MPARFRICAHLNQSLLNRTNSVPTERYIMLLRIVTSGEDEHIKIQTVAELKLAVSVALPLEAARPTSHLAIITRPALRTHNAPNFSKIRQCMAESLTIQ